MVERLFFAVPQGCLRFVIVVIPDHTHLLFLVGLAVAKIFLFSEYVHVAYQRSSRDKAYIFPGLHDYKHQIFKLP